MFKLFVIYFCLFALAVIVVKSTNQVLYLGILTVVMTVPVCMYKNTHPGLKALVSWCRDWFCHTPSGVKQVRSFRHVSIPASRLYRRRPLLDGTDEMAGSYQKLTDPWRHIWFQVPLRLSLITSEEAESGRTKRSTPKMKIVNG